ncbi:ubiquitin domain-containing protein 2-like isoform X1 [Penaeus indicus]|uniref:ubiquitin domain-containing protein 2-like isoform X1 n=1 Tax=Penaeus japonicus TaxID=27405 RepID=UPI001C716833|nr:ubiquitin domain-containing protein 2-like isoform X1 [Penaeus japonicus]XP_047489573.1 ubiquitin domain-containing protein 2-like isoform X1 [Penaeus chinensis]
MGGCVGTAREGSASSRTSSGEGSTSLRGGTSIGKNVPLRHEKIRWKSDMPLTEGQVRSKRDEFWDTAPAFEGRREIWDALKAAAGAIENQDYDLAQAIIDGASITLPNGTLTDCYDELGTRYQLPVYCLSYPLNILQRSPDKEGDNETEGSVEGEEQVLKVRLSTTSKDVKLPVRSTDTIATAKRKLEMQENLGAVRQRWFYSGKLLGDRLHVCECNIQHNYVVQAIITEERMTPVDS